MFKLFERVLRPTEHPSQDSAETLDAIRSLENLSNPRAPTAGNAAAQIGLFCSRGFHALRTAASAMERKTLTPSSEVRVIRAMTNHCSVLTQKVESMLRNELFSPSCSPEVLQINYQQIGDSLAQLAKGVQRCEFGAKFDTAGFKALRQRLEPLAKFVSRIANEPNNDILARIFTEIDPRASETRSQGTFISSRARHLTLQQISTCLGYTQSAMPWTSYYASNSLTSLAG